MYPARDTQIHTHNGSDPIFTFLGDSGPDAGKTAFSQSSEVIAIITINNTGVGDPRPTVQYRDLASIAIPSPIKNVYCYHYIPPCSSNVQRPEDSSSECIKACLKAKKSLNRFLAFISGSKTVDGRISSSSRGKALLTVGKNAIVERFEVKAREGTKHTGNVMVNLDPYFETNCVTHSSRRSLHSGEFKPIDLDTIQYFKLRNRDLKAKDKIEDFSSVDIISGMCLFSRDYLGNFDTSQYSSDNLPLLSDPRPTLYEIESLIRLPNAIADVISALPARLRVTITLDVPKVQYYAFFVDLYFEGLCSKEYINTQLDLIDKRHSQLAESFIKIIKEALDRRDIIDRRNIQIKISGGMAEIAPHIRNAINQGHMMPSTEDLWQKTMDLDPYFQRYCELLTEPPQDILSLCGTSYSYEIIRPILYKAHEQENAAGLRPPKSQDRQLLIQIDNKSEQRTYIEAARMLKEFQLRYPSSAGDPLFMAMFPTERIFTAENTGRTSLYLRGIGQNIYDSFAKRSVSTVDIVRRVYGEDVTRRVVRLMKEEGMFDVSGIPVMM